MILDFLIMSKRRKTIVYILFIGMFIYSLVYVEFFNGEFSPLQVLSDARSEAKRLLRFILLYQYQCNVTLQTTNYSAWPICLEPDVGINIELSTSKVAYSIGPSEDGEFEKLLIRNLSFSVFIFTHYRIPTSDFILQHKQNNTHVYRTTIVPNDPADFSRNSFDTQTVNNVLATLRHNHLDILKIDNVADTSRSHDILYYLVKDGTLKNVGQLHIVLRIDKADDEYLYNWYRTLYNLFHQAGFRLYHTAASDQLCLQVTLMESCVYYMSWIKDPGPRTFVLYPPALDGSVEFELERFLDYLKNTAAECDETFSVPSNKLPPLCLDDKRRKADRKCRLIILREYTNNPNQNTPRLTECNVFVLWGRDFSSEDGEIVNVETDGHRTSVNLPLLEALDRYFLYRTSNIFYIDAPHAVWNLITPILNSGVLQICYQYFFHSRWLYDHIKCIVNVCQPVHN
ncbi:hypothetical protein KUTeg_014225 [Tegillarca granosa]|uniref:Uncharacterized protein n=1 Tax=Tegillarca granosa TaxID=220873 RepID=A0ABQ9EVZ6_TEGGR|nr:hypothetical protein KUTeg_014225 [Tegillarca granosa]